jgi:hypothetical protein
LPAAGADFVHLALDHTEGCLISPNYGFYAVALEPRLACKAPLCERLLPRSMPIRP